MGHHAGTRVSSREDTPTSTVRIHPVDSRCGSDASITYNIGFYPASDASDGKFHKLTLKVDRQGETLRYQSGYYDLPQSTKSGQAEVDDAVWSPLDSMGIPMPEKDKWDVLVRMDANSIGLEQNGDRWKATLRMLYV